MKGGFLEYKCRRCGKVVKNVHVPDALIALCNLEVEGVTPKIWGMQMRMTEIHHCADGNLGMSDLIGAVFDQKEE